MIKPITPARQATLDAEDFYDTIRYLLKAAPWHRRWTISITSATAVSARWGELLENQFRIAWSGWNAPSREKMSVYQEMSTAMRTTW